MLCLFPAVKGYIYSLRGLSQNSALGDTRSVTGSNSSPWPNPCLCTPAPGERGCAVCERTGPASIWKPHPDSPYSHTRQALQVKKPQIHTNKQTVCSLFNRLRKSLSWKNRCKEQTKLNSSQYLARCLSGCSAILYLVLWHTLTAQHYAACDSEEIWVIFSVPPTPGPFPSAQMEY